MQQYLKVLSSLLILKPAKTKITQDGDLVECWMEDDLSLAYKMSEIRKADLAGTAAWKLTQERENFFHIINMN